MKISFVLILAMLLITSCKGPIKNPHTEDPIYQFYKKEADENNKNIEKQREDIAKTNLLIGQALPQSGQKRDLVETLFEQKNKLEQYYERKDYVDQKMKEIIKIDLQKYKAAYENKKPWPDPADEVTFNLKKEMESFKNKEWSAEKRVRKYLKGRNPVVHHEDAAEGEVAPAPSSH